VSVYARRPLTLDGLLRRAAQRWPDRPALEAPAGVFRYSEFDAAVTAAAAGLRDAGVRPGDRVAVALSHDALLSAVPFVASRAGCSALLLNTALPAVQWARQLAAVQPAVCVADAPHLDRMRAAAPRVRLVAAPDDVSLDPASAADDPALEVRENAPVVLLATSGTTAEPKVIPLTNRGLIHAGLAYLDLLPWGDAERSLVVMPLYYIGALSTQTVPMPLIGGCNVVPADTRAAAAAREIVERRITFVDAVPSWLGLLVRQPPFSAPRWRSLVHGGSPMPAATAAALAAAHPGLAMFDVWGLSEAHGPVTAHRYDPERPPAAGVVGRPLTGLRVRARAPAGDAAPGEAGELEVHGPTVMAGYVNRPATIRRGGWLPTGDVGSVDGSGAVRVLARAKDVIDRGGRTIHSVEVEAALRSVAGVLDAAVYGTPDPVAGEAVAAALVLDPAAELDIPALRAAVRERVGGHAVPRLVRVVDDLPRNAAGKVDKRRLRRAD